VVYINARIKMLYGELELNSGKVMGYPFAYTTTFCGGKGFGVGATPGERVGPGLGIGLGVGVGPGLGIGLGVGVGLGAGRGLGAAPGLGVGIGLGAGCELGIGPGIGLGLGVGLGLGFNLGVGACSAFLMRNPDAVPAPASKTAVKIIKNKATPGCMVYTVLFYNVHFCDVFAV
jgi:hypothetical protein